jgi:signal transduction histidine kinase
MDRRSQWLDTQQQEQRVLHRQQKDLMDNLLHQFRNPLTAMRTFGKLLMKRMVETDGNREVASSIVRESDRLQGLLVQFEAAVDLTEDRTEHRTEQAALAPGLLSLPESSSLGRELTIETLDVLTVLAPAVRSARAMTDDRNQKLKAILPETPLWVQGDVSALGEVFSNLLDNASKYTPPNGEIQVTLEVRSDKLHVHITDNGYGIPPEDLPRLFERHFRGVRADSAIPGTGLGLAIVRDLLHHMGGDIEVISPPLGCDRGTMARITLSNGGLNE